MEVVFIKRVILHCDLNNFYASVACLDNPELRNKAVAVAGNPEERHGIILAKNMAAKKCGVSTGEVIWQAKLKCPNLVTVPPNFKRYEYFSKKARKIYEDFSDMVEPFGPDEAWIDVSGSCVLFGSGEQIAEMIRKRIRDELGLTVSIGVSFNKVFAKIGSDLKKPDAISVISKENFKSVVWPLPIEAMIGIGGATKRKLNENGIITLGDLARAKEDSLKRILGKLGPQYKLYANGLDTSRVAPSDYEHIPKSISRSTTTEHNLETRDDVWRTLLFLAEEVATELRKYSLEATGVGLHLRTSGLKVNELQAPLSTPTQLGFNLATAGIKLFESNYDFSTPLRSIGIKAINLQTANSSARQIYLFSDVKEETRLETIENQMDILRSRFGKECICRGVNLHEKKAPAADKPFSMMYK